MWCESCREGLRLVLLDAAQSADVEDVQAQSSALSLSVGAAPLALSIRDAASERTLAHLPALASALKLVLSRCADGLCYLRIADGTVGIRL